MEPPPRVCVTPAKPTANSTMRTATGPVQSSTAAPSRLAASAGTSSSLFDKTAPPPSPWTPWLFSCPPAGAGPRRNPPPGPEAATGILPGSESARRALRAERLPSGSPQEVQNRADFLQNCGHSPSGPETGPPLHATAYRTMSSSAMGSPAHRRVMLPGVRRPGPSPGLVQDQALSAAALQLHGVDLAESAHVLGLPRKQHKAFVVFQRG